MDTVVISWVAIYLLFEGHYIKALLLLIAISGGTQHA